MRALVNFTGWLVGGVIIATLFLAAYRVNPWVPVAVIFLSSAAFGAITVGVRR